MAKRNTSKAPAAAAESTETTAADVAPAAAVTDQAAAAAEEVTPATEPQAPAAPAASEPATSDTPPATDPAPSAEPAAAPESPPAAPPASAELDPAGGTVNDVDMNGIHDAIVLDAQASAAAALALATDQSQETLEKQAEVKQPEVPRLDRVLHRLQADLDKPLAWDIGMMATHTCFLHGPAIELMTRLHLAIVAEGIPVNTQGDSLQFLLEELDKSLREAF